MASEAFSGLLDENVERRLENALKISSCDVNNQQLRRLIRGAGSALLNSKIGFYTALAGFVRNHQDQTFCNEILSIMDSELKVTTKALSKETADAYVGRVLVVTALIRQGSLAKSTTENINTAVKILVMASKQKSYHIKIAFNGLVLLTNQLTEKQFKASITPALKNELQCPIEKHTIYSVNFLMEAQNLFPKLVTKELLLHSIGNEEIVNSESYQHIYNIFWQEQSEFSIMHSAYEKLGSYLSASKDILPFWAFVVQKLKNDYSRKREIITVKLITDILRNLTNSDDITCELLNKDFLSIVFASLKKANNNDELYRAVYLEFFECLLSTTLLLSDCKQVEVIEKLIVGPGTIAIDKYTLTSKFLTRAVARMKANALEGFYEILKAILIDEKSNGTKEKWLNFEKFIALKHIQKILGSRNISHDFKLTQLKFLATSWLFSESDWLSEELKINIKNLFYRTLDTPFSKLEDEKIFVLKLVDFIDLELKKTTAKENLDKAHLKLWNNAIRTVREETTSTPMLVFHILLLHITLQLLNEPELASESIKELMSCVDRLRLNNRPTSEEPAWIEVLIDLFMHLLSLNSTVLRNLIKKLFPFVCSDMTLTAVHQMLSLLDLDEENPLHYDDAEKEDETSDSEDREEDNVEESDSQSEDSEDTEREGDSNISNQLRNAVTSALMSTEVPSDDQESVNIDDITEEEGNRLDSALSEAFKMWGGGKQKPKTDKFESTALIHFRNRIMDLLILYLKVNTDIVVVLEVLTVLYKMLDYEKEEAMLDLLANKIEEGIKTGTTFKKHIDTEITIEQNDLATYLRKFVSKGKNPKFIDLKHSCLQRILKFIVAVDTKMTSQNLKNDKESVSIVLKQELADFLEQRSPNLNFSDFAYILQINWKGNWNLMEVLCEFGLNGKTRAFRRIQAIELLRTFYKNIRLLRTDQKKTDKNLEVFYEKLQLYSETFLQKIVLKEFKAIVGLLLDVYYFHQSHLPIIALLPHIQQARTALVLDNAGSLLYNRFCSIFGSVKLDFNEDMVQNLAAFETVSNQQESKPFSRKRTAQPKHKKNKKVKRALLSSALVPIHFSTYSNVVIN